MMVGEAEDHTDLLVREELWELHVVETGGR
jgi:hypothetical protein